MREIDYRFYVGKNQTIPVDYDYSVSMEDIFAPIYEEEYADVLPFDEAYEHFTDLPLNLQETIIDNYWQAIKEYYESEAYDQFLEDRNSRKIFAHWST